VAIQRLTPDPEPSWQALSACRPGPDDTPQQAVRRFYPLEAEGRGGVRTNLHSAAKARCASCPVRGECLHDALERDEGYGVWGQLDATERRRIRGRVDLAHIPRTSVSVTIRSVAAYRIIPA
jgi:WhiB family redox-sensing transcriptional regulator